MAKTKRTTPKTPMMAMPMREKKQVSIKEADNGFVVSSWNGNGEKVLTAKNANEAMRHAKSLLGAKKRS